MKSSIRMLPIKASSKVVFMNDGVILEQGDPESIFTNPKEQRTKEFLSRYING